MYCIWYEHETKSNLQTKDKSFVHCSLYTFNIFKELKSIQLQFHSFHGLFIKDMIKKAKVQPLQWISECFNALTTISNKSNVTRT